MPEFKPNFMETIQGKDDEIEHLTKLNKDLRAALDKVGNFLLVVREGIEILEKEKVDGIR